MGSTVSTNKLAAAFKTTSGKTMYVLFEETYESNCYPRTPRWGCLMMGEIANTMRGIFRSAGSCEGGMLKGAGGRDISPEGYIQGCGVFQGSCRVDRFFRPPVSAVVLPAPARG